VRPTRKQLLAGAGAGALGAAGIYELADRMAAPPERADAADVPLPAEQHVLQGVRVVHDNGIAVLVPPLHHQLVMLQLRTGTSAKALRDAQKTLEHTLASLERRYAPTPSGLGITVAWGLPYFRRYVSKQAAKHLPVDRRASKAKGKRLSALLDAVRFPSDPSNTILERNDAVLLLRSDSLDAIHAGAKELVAKLDFWRPTSTRRGFVGGGFEGGKSLPKRLATAAGVPGAEFIPNSSELFLGFTSTQRGNLGPERIANLETLGYSDGGPGGYFLHGTCMHVSHIFEDLLQWYTLFNHTERVSTVFSPTTTAPSGTLTVRQGASDVSTTRDNVRDYHRYRAIGHSASIQTTSRLLSAVRGKDGTLYPKGTAIPQRADFNTLDNPFFTSSRPVADGMTTGAAAGVHFVVFNPTSDDFHRNRLAMDGVMPDGTRLPFDPNDRGQGINAVLKTTHRQNFLVPPRRHRSFPLAELRA
jgi:hypothetical protein